MIKKKVVEIFLEIKNMITKTKKIHKILSIIRKLTAKW